MQLATTGVWPLAHAMKNTRLYKTIAQLRSSQLRQADDPVEYPGTREPCATCKKNFGRRLMFLQEAAETTFKRHCVDCVKHRKPD